MPRSRIFYVAVAVVLAIFLGARLVRRSQLRSQSPFVMWEFRAGGRYSVLEKSAFRQTRQRFVCHDIVPTAKLCEMRVTGIGGLVRLLVDDDDRIAALQFAPDSATPAMREESRRVAAEWNLVRAGVSSQLSPTDTTSTITRWRSENGKWTAYMRHGHLRSTPVLVHLADQSALAAIGQAAPLASYVLAMNGLIDGADVPNADDVDDVLATTMYRRATDPANETPVPAARSALPTCVAERSDLIAPATLDSRSAYSDVTMAVLERAVPVVFPGSRLAVGDGTWLVDSAGWTERVLFTHGGFNGAPEGSVVFGVSIPGRSAVAAQRIEDGVPDRLCRAPGLLLFARVNPDSSLAEAHLIPVDHEAIGSEIEMISLVDAAGPTDTPHIRVRYASAYVGDGASGTVAWESVIANDPPRTTVRVPLVFQQREAGSEDSRDGFLVMTGRSESGIELSTLEQTSWGFASRTITVPLDASGVLSGTRIIERLASPRPTP